MKVLYIIHATVMGGATISFKNMIDGVVKRGIKPTIVYSRNQYNELIADFEKKFKRNFIFSAVCIPCFWFFSMNDYERNLIKEPVKKILGKKLS